MDFRCAAANKSVAAPAAQTQLLGGEGAAMSSFYKKSRLHSSHDNAKATLSDFPHCGTFPYGLDLNEAFRELLSGSTTQKVNVTCKMTRLFKTCAEPEPQIPEQGSLNRLDEAVSGGADMTRSFEVVLSK